MNKPPSIVSELQKLTRAEITDIEHDCTAADVASAVCMLLDEIILKDDTECDKLADWEQEIRELRCKILGEHVWEHDQCGYWGHQYCTGCGLYKYPELGKLRCSEAIEQIGRIDESEYANTGELMHTLDRDGMRDRIAEVLRQHRCRDWHYDNDAGSMQLLDVLAKNANDGTVSAAVEEIDELAADIASAIFGGDKLVPVASHRCGEIFPNRSPDAPTDFDGCILPSGHDGGHEFVGSDLLLYGWEIEIDCAAYRAITYKLIR